MRINLVDDHVPFRLAARRLLEAQDCLVVAEAEAGELALAEVDGSPPVVPEYQPAPARYSATASANAASVSLVDGSSSAIT